MAEAPTAAQREVEVAREAVAMAVATGATLAAAVEVYWEDGKVDLVACLVRVIVVAAMAAAATR